MFFANLLPFCFLIWALMVFYSTFEVSDFKNWHGCWQVVLVGVWIILPFRSVIKCFRPEVQRIEADSYEKRHLDFINDYD